MRSLDQFKIKYPWYTLFPYDTYLVDETRYGTNVKLGNFMSLEPKSFQLGRTKIEYMKCK